MSGRGPTQSPKSKMEQNRIHGLGMATHSHDVKSIKNLLDSKMDVNAVVGGGETALLMASHHYESGDMIRLLLRYGADVNVRGVDGTPLETARKWDCRQAIWALTAHRRSIHNFVSGQLSTLLNKASKFDTTQLTKPFLGLVTKYMIGTNVKIKRKRNYPDVFNWLILLNMYLNTARCVTLEKMPDPSVVLVLSTL